jgi:hypothetical protein
MAPAVQHKTKGQSSFAALTARELQRHDKPCTSLGEVSMRGVACASNIRIRVSTWVGSRPRFTSLVAATDKMAASFSIAEA